MGFELVSFRLNVYSAEATNILLLGLTVLDVVSALGGSTVQ